VTLLKPEDVGYIFLIESIIIISSVIFSFASDEVIRRYVYIKDFNIHNLDKPVNAIDSINSIVFFLILFLFFFIDDINYVFALVIGLVLSYRSPFIASNVARKDLNYLSFYTFWIAIFTTLFSLIFIKNQYYIEIRLLILLLQAICFRILLKVPFNFKLSFITQILSDYLIVLPIYINRIFGIITTHLLPMIVIFYVDISAYGKYQYLIKISSVLFVLQSTLNQIIEPTIIKLYNRFKSISFNIIVYILKTSLLILSSGLFLYFILYYFSNYINLDLPIFKYNLIYLIFSSVILFFVENVWRIQKYLGQVNYLAFMNIYAFLFSILIIFLMASIDIKIINHFALSVLFANITLMFVTIYYMKKT
jgi:hypothetical protein